MATHNNKLMWTFKFPRIDHGWAKRAFIHDDVHAVSTCVVAVVRRAKPTVGKCKPELHGSCTVNAA